MDSAEGVLSGSLDPDEEKNGEESRPEGEPTSGFSDEYIQYLREKGIPLDGHKGPSTYEEISDWGSYLFERCGDSEEQKGKIRALGTDDLKNRAFAAPAADTEQESVPEANSLGSVTPIQEEPPILGERTEELPTLEQLLENPEATDEEDDDPFPDSSNTTPVSRETLAQIVSEKPKAKEIIDPESALTEGDFVPIKAAVDRIDSPDNDLSFSKENLKKARDIAKDKITETGISGNIGGLDQQNITYIDFLLILYEMGVDRPPNFHRYDKKQQNLYAKCRWDTFPDWRKIQVVRMLSEATDKQPAIIRNSYDLILEKEIAATSRESCMSLQSKIDAGILRPRVVLKRKNTKYDRLNEHHGFTPLAPNHDSDDRDIAA